MKRLDIPYIISSAFRKHSVVRLKVKRVLLQPARVMMAGFLALILLGAKLLTLPVMSTGEPLKFVDALFTATSGTCVTGLTVIDPGADLTFWGQLVLILLIQVGGLGFMTFGTVLLMALGRRISLSGRVMLSNAWNEDGLQGMVKLTARIFTLALSIEGIGAVLLMTRMIPRHGLRGVWYSVFHAISAFCNAGFDLAGGFGTYRNDAVVLLVVMMLITLGGIGFSVMFDIHKSRCKWHRLSLQSRIVLVMSAILTVGGGLCFALLEWNNPKTLADPQLHPVMKPIAALFQAVTLRTAGFQTLVQNDLTSPSLVLTLLLMFIGASPASTGGGIKTTTFAVFCLMIYNVLRGQEKVSVFRRTINTHTLNQAVVLTTLALLLTMVSHIVLSLVLPASEVVTASNLLYEVVSALTTAGMTVGVTAELNTAGKIILCLVMFTGRVGLMTIAYGLTKKASHGKNNLAYPEGRIMIG